MYEFEAALWQWSAKEATWTFLTVPPDVSDDIEAQSADGKVGFGSVRVEVTIGATTWRTSVFPSNEHEAYVLPVKKAVRTAEGIDEGDTVAVALRVVDA